MYIPKRYGQSKINACPFCGKRAITENSQGVPVCIKHKGDSLDLKCICGDWLDVLSGKWGPYCRCMCCGNISWAKAMEVNPNISQKNVVKEVKEDRPRPFAPKRQFPGREKIKSDGKKKEIVIRSEELDF